MKLKELISVYLFSTIFFSGINERIEELVPGVVLNIFAINTWLLPYINFGPNGPSWTVCTLFFWYWCFPFIFPRLQRLSDRQIAHGIVKYFWLSIGLVLLVLFYFGPFVSRDIKNAVSKETKMKNNIFL